MGVSTLIIFITAILVSAVAASVIVRTVGILQERAFTVGTEVRNRLVTALDYISITSYNNITLERAYGLTVLVRTRPGSYAYDLASTGLLFTSDQGTSTARLQHTENEDYGFRILTLDNATFMNVPDMDGDKTPERLRLYTQPGDDAIMFRFSRDDAVAYADLGVDISTAAPGNSINVSVNDTPIVADDGRWFGFIQVFGNTTDPSMVNVSAPGTYLNITHYPQKNFCDFDRLIPDTAFCYNVQLGNTDTAVTRGEIYKLYYRMRPQNYLEPDEDFEVKFIPEKGDVTTAIGKMPDSIQRDSGQVWPTSLES